MSDLKRIVTPLTRGIVWLPKEQDLSNDSRYAEIDYLLDGLLTANFKGNSGSFSSRLIIGSNFGKLLYVFVIKEIMTNEVESFVSLIKKDLLPENDIIVVDETDSSHKLKKDFTEIFSHLKFIT